MLQRGDAARARELFQRATQADPGHPSLWSNLAQSLHQLNLLNDELDAIDRALALEPRHLSSLLQKGQVHEQMGDARNAARAYRNALATVPAGRPPPEGVAALVEHARTLIAKDDAALAEAIEQRLAPIREQHGGGVYRRVAHCIDLLTGRRTRFTPQPTFMYFPEIPAVEFFERGDFPWLDAIEAATDEIRAELMTVLVSRYARGSSPTSPTRKGCRSMGGRELDEFTPLRARTFSGISLCRSRHTWRAVPRTVEILKSAPQCDVARRAPTASLDLEPGTRIPPHTGVTNTRVTVHLPLMVPPDCGLRVGSGDAAVGSRGRRGCSTTRSSTRRGTSPTCRARF